MEKAVEAQYQLIDSFVYQVGQYLPESQRSEISTDLKQSVYEEVESAVEAQGRPVTEDQLLEVIGRFGHPLKVANSYLPQRYLIGPEIFPVYTRALRTFLTLAIAGMVVYALTMSVSSGWQIGIWSMLGAGLEILLWVVVVLTGVCVAIEFGGEQFNWYENWNPRDLARHAVGPMDRSDVVTNLVSEGFFLLWWNDVVVFTNVLPAGALELSFSAAWAPYGIALNLIFGLSFVIHAYVLVIGHWRKFPMIAEIVLFSATVGLGLVLLTSETLVLVTGVVGEGVTRETGLEFPGFIDNIVRVVLAVVIFFTIWDILKGLKMWRGGFDAGTGRPSVNS